MSDPAPAAPTRAVPVTGVCDDSNGPTCTCTCYGCQHHCAAHDPDPNAMTADEYNHWADVDDSDLDDEETHP